MAADTTRRFLELVVAGNYTGRIGERASADLAGAETSWKKFASVATTAGVGIGVAAAGIGVLSVKAASSFNSTMLSVANNTAMSSRQLDQMRKGVLKLGAEGPAKMADIAGAFEHVSNVMNLQGKQAMPVVTAAWKSAIETGGTVTDTANALVTAMHNFHQPASAATQDMSYLMDAAAHGNIRLQDLVTNFSKIGIAASSIHMPFADALGAFSALTKSTGSASEAQTLLGGMINHMISPTKAATTALTAMGPAGLGVLADFKQFASGQISFMQVLKDVRDVYPQVSGNVKQLTSDYQKYQSGQITTAQLQQDVTSTTHGTAGAIFSLFGGLRGGLGALALMGNQWKSYVKVNAQVHASQNLTNQQWARTSKEFSFMAGTIGNQVQILEIHIGEGLIPVLKDIVPWVLKAISAVGKFTSGFPGGSKRLIEIGLAIGGISLAMKGVMALASPFTAVFKKIFALGGKSLGGSVAGGMLGHSTGTMNVEANIVNVYGKGSAAGNAVQDIEKTGSGLLGWLTGRTLATKFPVATGSAVRLAAGSPELLGMGAGELTYDLWGPKQPKHPASPAQMHRYITSKRGQDTGTPGYQTMLGNIGNWLTSGDARPSQVTPLGSTAEVTKPNNVVMTDPAGIPLVRTATGAGIPIDFRNSRMPQSNQSGIQGMGALADNARNAAGALKGNVGATAYNVGHAIAAVPQNVGTFAGQMGSAVGGGLGAIGQGVGSNIGPLLRNIQALPKDASAAFGKLAGIVGSSIGSIVKTIGDFAGKMVSAGTSLIKSLIDGIGKAKDDVTSAAGNIWHCVWSEIGAKAGDVVGWGTSMTSNLVKGIKSISGDVTNAGKTVWHDVWLQINGSVGNAIGWGEEIVKNLATGLLTDNPVIDAAKNVFQVITDHLKVGSAPKAMGSGYDPTEWGKQISAQVAGGMTANEKLIAAASRSAYLTIHIKDYKDRGIAAGAAVAQGVANGITANQKLINAALSSSLNVGKFPGFGTTTGTGDPSSVLKAFVHYVDTFDNVDMQCTALATKWLQKMGKNVPNAQYAYQWASSQYYKPGTKGVAPGDVLVWKQNNFDAQTGSAGHVDIFYKFGRQNGQLGFWTYDANWGPGSNEGAGLQPKLVWHKLEALQNDVSGYLNTPSATAASNLGTASSSGVRGGLNLNNVPSGVAKWSSQIMSASKATGMPPAVIAAIMQGESGGQANALSPTGAVGLMQLEPGTAANYGGSTYNPGKNIMEGAQYLAYLYNGPAGHDWKRAFSMYYAGPGGAYYAGYANSVYARAQSYGGFGSSKDGGSPSSSSGRSPASGGTSGRHKPVTPTAHWKWEEWKAQSQIWDLFQGTSPNNMTGSQLKVYQQLYNQEALAAYKVAWLGQQKRKKTLGSELAKGTIGQGAYTAGMQNIGATEWHDWQVEQQKIQKLTDTAANAPLIRSIAWMKWQEHQLSTQMKDQQPWTQGPAAQKTWMTHQKRLLWLQEQSTISTAKLDLRTHKINPYEYHHDISQAKKTYQAAITHAKALIPDKHLSWLDQKMRGTISTITTKWSGTKLSTLTQKGLKQWESDELYNDKLRHQVMVNEATILHNTGVLDNKQYAARLAADQEWWKNHNAEVQYKAAHKGASSAASLDKGRVIPAHVIGNCAMEGVKAAAKHQSARDKAAKDASGGVGAHHHVHHHDTHHQHAHHHYAAAKAAAGGVEYQSPVGGPNRHDPQGHQQAIRTNTHDTAQNTSNIHTAVQQQTAVLIALTNKIDRMLGASAQPTRNLSAKVTGSQPYRH